MQENHITIAGAKDVFQVYLSPDFKKWGLDNKQKKTKKTTTNTYIVVKNANFSQIFNSLSNDLDKLCLTQSQVISFCKNTYLKQDYPIFFLIKENEKYFIVSVYMHYNG